MHKNLQLGARIALSLPSFLGGFVQGANESILALLFSASRAHVTSDDAFEVDFRFFLEKFHPLAFDLEKKISESPDFPALHSTVMAHLSFLKIVLLTENNSVESTEIIADHFKLFPTLLPALMGLRNQQTADLSCHVYRLLLEKLDLLFPEGISEVRKP